MSRAAKVLQLTAQAQPNPAQRVRIESFIAQRGKQPIVTGERLKKRKYDPDFDYNDDRHKSTSLQRHWKKQPAKRPAVKAGHKTTAAAGISPRTKVRRWLKFNEENETELPTKRDTTPAVDFTDLDSISAFEGTVSNIITFKLVGLFNVVNCELFF